MIITRPYEAEDNELNKEMLNILVKYLAKEKIEPSEIQIYGSAVNAICGDVEYYISKAEGCRARTYEKRNFFYMQKKQDGKRKRIKKEEWI